MYIDFRRAYVTMCLCTSRHFRVCQCLSARVNRCDSKLRIKVPGIFDLLHPGHVSGLAAAVVVLLAAAIWLLVIGGCCWVLVSLWLLFLAL